jgi:uncharacterized protein YndB with AHSA1/START domain
MPGAPRVHPLEPRTLEWIERAPVVVVGRATTTASPDAVFAVLADHERWPEWFRTVRHVEVTGAAAGVGARRRVRVPGAVFDEEFIAWEPGVRFAFTGTAARPRVLRSLVEDCRIDAAGGLTTVTYTMYMDPARGFGLPTKVAAAGIRLTLRKAMESLVTRAAR